MLKCVCEVYSVFFHISKPRKSACYATNITKMTSHGIYWFLQVGREKDERIITLNVKLAPNLMCKSEKSCAYRRYPKLRNEFRFGMLSSKSQDSLNRKSLSSAPLFLPRLSVGEMS